MKKLAFTVAVLLALVAVLGSFSGCGGVNAPDGYYLLTDYGNGGDDWTEVFVTAVEGVRSASRYNSHIYLPKGEYIVKDTVIIPSSVSLIFAEGAVLTVADGGSFVMNGRSIIAPKNQIFRVEGEGRLSGFSNGSVGCPEWFGAVAGDGIDDSAAIEAALARFVTLEFSEGVYDIASTVNLAPASKTIDSVVLEGAGTGKTVFRIASGITALLADGVPNYMSCADIRGISFEEDGGGRTSTAIEIAGESTSMSPKCMINDCDFRGFAIAFDTHNSGFMHFRDNYAENCGTVCKIGAGSMFMFYKYNTVVDSGIFISCDIPANGGYSNGIDIVGCKVSGSEQYDLYIGDNQAVFINECEFTDGKGEASVYFKNVSDYRIVNTVITSDASAKSRVGFYSNGAHSGLVTGCTFENNGQAIFYKGPSGWRAMTLITANTFTGSLQNDIYLRATKDIKIVGNIFDSALPRSGESYDIFAKGKVTDIIVADNSFPAEYKSFIELSGLGADSLEYGNTIG